MISSKCAANQRIRSAMRRATGGSIRSSCRIADLRMRGVYTLSQLQAAQGSFERLASFTFSNRALLAEKPLVNRIAQPKPLIRVAQQFDDFLLHGRLYQFTKLIPRHFSNCSCHARS